MLRVLIAIAIAVPLYELLRWQVLRRARTALLRKARAYAKRHGVRMDLFEGSHPHGRDLLGYYARSLAALDLPASRALEARVGTTP